MQEVISVRGRAKVFVDGKLTARPSNLVVAGGLQRFWELIAQDSANYPSWIAIGTSGLGTEFTDSALKGAEVVRGQITSTTVSGQKITFEADLQIPSTLEVAEYGMFSDSVGGVMFARFVTPSVTVAAGSIVKVVWELSFAPFEEE